MKAGHPHFLKPLLYRWLFTYKLYHLPFWFIYHYTFWMLATGSTPGLFSSPYTFKFFFYVIFQAAGVYFNLYFLIPRILEKGRQGTYLALLLLTLFCTAALIVPGYYISAWAAGISFQEAFGKEPADYMFFFKTYTLPSTLASMTLGMSVKLTKNWIQSKRREQLLEKEKLETELKFLRAQFNPHFLFNTITPFSFSFTKIQPWRQKHLPNFQTCCVTSYTSAMNPKFRCGRN